MDQEPASTEDNSEEESHEEGSELQGDVTESQKETRVKFATDRSKVDQLLQADLGNKSHKPEVSISAVVKMMGLATSTEVKLIEGKFDLVLSRLNSLTMRLERLMQDLGDLPTGGDFERLEAQFVVLRGHIKNTLETVAPPSEQGVDKEEEASKAKIKEFLKKNSQAIDASEIADTDGSGEGSSHGESVDEVSQDAEK